MLAPLRLMQVTYLVQVSPIYLTYIKVEHLWAELPLAAYLRPTDVSREISMEADGGSK